MYLAFNNLVSVSFEISKHNVYFYIILKYDFSFTLIFFQRFNTYMFIPRSLALQHVSKNLNQRPHAHAVAVAAVCKRM